MLTKISKKNATEVSYEMLSAAGKLVNRKQSFNVMPSDANDQDYYDLGSSISNILAYAPKEILKNVVEALVEA